MKIVHKVLRDLGIHAQEMKIVQIAIVKDYILRAD